MTSLLQDQWWQVGTERIPHQHRLLSSQTTNFAPEGPQPVRHKSLVHQGPSPDLDVIWLNLGNCGFAMYGKTKAFHKTIAPGCGTLGILRRYPTYGRPTFLWGRWCGVAMSIKSLRPWLKLQQDFLIRYRISDCCVPCRTTVLCDLLITWL